MSSELLPPAQPVFILRGHAAQIHAVHFTPGNARLVTADADGWVVSWNLSVKRPVAVWKAHDNAILGLGSWGSNRIITHGRDNKLLVWQLGPADEANMDKILPVGAGATSKKQPWLLHSLPVNALNFCAFAMCYDGMPQAYNKPKAINDSNSPRPILLAVPNAVDSGGIDIFQLPSRVRAAVIHADRSITTGMVMTLSILADTTKIQVAAGYESGHTMVFVQTDPGAVFEKLYSAQSHTQPVLSLSISPSKDHYITTSADAIIAKHPFPLGPNIWKNDYKTLQVAPTKHSGQQGLAYRSDGRIFATAGWDSHARVYSAKTMNEIAVLKWHKEGCYATAFAAVGPTPSVSSSMAPGSATTTGKGTPSRPKLEDSANASSNELSTKHPASSTTVSTTVQEKRDEKAQTTHYLAVGAKDGKISLWDIY